MFQAWKHALSREELRNTTCMHPINCVPQRRFEIFLLSWDKTTSDWPQLDLDATIDAYIADPNQTTGPGNFAGLLQFVIHPDQVLFVARHDRNVF